MAQIRLQLPWAADLMDVWEAVPHTVTFVGHSLFAAGLAPEFKGHWLVHYLVRGGAVQCRRKGRAV